MDRLIARETGNRITDSAVFRKNSTYLFFFPTSASFSRVYYPKQYKKSSEFVKYLLSARDTDSSSPATCIAFSNLSEREMATAGAF